MVKNSQIYWTISQEIRACLTIWKTIRWSVVMDYKITDVMVNMTAYHLFGLMNYQLKFAIFMFRLARELEMMVTFTELLQHLGKMECRKHHLCFLETGLFMNYLLCQVLLSLLFHYMAFLFFVFVFAFAF